MAHTGWGMGVFKLVTWVPVLAALVAAGIGCSSHPQATLSLDGDPSVRTSSSHAVVGGDRIIVDFSYRRGSEQLTVRCWLERSRIELGDHSIAAALEWRDFYRGNPPVSSSEPLDGNTPWVSNVGIGFDCECEEACDCSDTPTEATVHGTLSITEFEDAGPPVARPESGHIEGTLDLTVDGPLPRRPPSIDRTTVHVDFSLEVAYPSG